METVENPDYKSLSILEKRIKLIATSSDDIPHPMLQTLKHKVQYAQRPTTKLCGEELDVHYTELWKYNKLRQKSKACTFAANSVTSRLVRLNPSVSLHRTKSTTQYMSHVTEQ
ncbi:hypothetical protein J6590_084605, partial [Homalodisca vitripennis]